MMHVHFTLSVKDCESEMSGITRFYITTLLTKSRPMLPQGSPTMHRAGVVFATAAPGATHRNTFTSLRYTAPAACCVVPSPPCFLRFPTYLLRKHQFRSREDGMEEQVRAIGEEIASLEDGSRNGVQALAECLMFVDLIQRLGIQRNFEEYIKKIMKTTYTKWDEEYGLGDAEPTVLAFRLLRLQGYHVSADVLKRLKDGMGTFSCFTIKTPSAILGMLNLYKCSQFRFPSEIDIMEEAEHFAISQLNIALSRNEPFLKTNNLRSEIKFAFDYPRRYLLPRLESRSIIRQLWRSNGRKRKYLEVARKDMEILQKQYKQEMFKIERWWEENTVEELPFNRGHILKSFFLVSATMFEPQFSGYRVAFTKSATLAVLLDDLFDYPASDKDGLSRFTESIQRWDPSPLNNYPEHKAVFVAIQSSMVEIATESSKAHGRDLLPYFKILWQDLVSWYYNETDWKYYPTLEEYIENGKCSIAAITCYCSSMFLSGDTITDAVMQHVGRDSRLLLFVGLIARLSNDIVTYQREVISGETISSVSCYMRDNPGCTEEEAITSLRQRVETVWNEFQLELFSCHGVVPESCRQAMLSLLRMYAFSYKNIDAYTESTHKI